MAQARRRRRNRIISITIVVALIGLIAVALGQRDDKGTKVSSDKTTSTTADKGKVGTSECPKPDGSSPRTITFKGNPKTCIDPAKTYTAHVSSSEGDFDIVLDTKKTPQTANNFVFLSRYHYYDNTTIFRIDDSLEILQTGSPHTESPGDPGPGYNIKDEGKGFQYAEGDVVMARGNAPDSASAQYFLVYGNKASVLNSQGTYVTFGKVGGDGLGVLKKIGALFQACTPEEQGQGTCLGGKPKNKVTIKSITVKES